MTRDAHDEARELIALGEESLGCAAGLAAEPISMNAKHAVIMRKQPAGWFVRCVLSPWPLIPAWCEPRRCGCASTPAGFGRRRERLWLVGMACLGVGLSATLTVPLLWRLFAWMGEWAGVSSWVWQAGFAFFWIAPALVVSALLLARGTHLTSNGEKQWR